MKRIFALASLLALTVTPAFAISVVNLDKIERKVIINNGGEVNEVVLIPNQVYRAYGPFMTLRVEGGAEMRSDDNDEYVIWPNGRLAIQKYGQQHRGHAW